MNRLAQSERERTLVSLRPTVSFLEALGRYQLEHDEHLRAILAGFSAEAFCRTVSELGASLPTGWESRAHAIDGRLGPLRDFYDLTILRGKDLAAMLLSSMNSRGVTRAVICCDGFLNAMLSRTFDARDVSWSLYIPKFPTR
jgi:hypothetical protein